jgi:thioester reductase-like protein
VASILLTGFPGFLGSELLPRILVRRPADRVVCVVQAKFADLARQRAAQIEARDPAFRGRIEIALGDITRPGLGLDDPAGVARSLAEIVHLAAVYDIAVQRAVGMKVNVEGTRNVLELAQSARKLERLQYVSTCYVSGRYPGIFRETDLDKGQEFANFYEETKFLAEVEVRNAMQGGLPASVYRPSIVVGDSRTGETQKYDGPYFVIRWVMKQPTLAVLPVVGDTHRNRVNLVPRDFIIDAIDRLSGMKAAAGRTYQLADPEPPTIDETVREIGRATGHVILRTPLPLRVAKGAIDWVPGVHRLLEMPSELLDYFVHPTYYDTTNTIADLAPLGIRCPRLFEFLPKLVAFMKAHPEITSDAMV